MRANPRTRDLYVLVADQDMAETMRALLGRPDSLKIGRVEYNVEKHQGRDPGCRTDSVRRLRPQIQDSRYALVMFDKEGCGQESTSREDIQRQVEQDLSRNGWEGRSKAIVIDPELETWVWSASNKVPEILGWTADYSNLKAWLASKGLWPSHATKPPDPKQAMRAALREKNQRVSSSLFGQLAESVTLSGCQCPAFNELIDTLQRWFPETSCS